ncbi:MAG: DUF433 domain-containing protein [Chloroflexi bacterium]|nr:DUF433 domain-containing protein [Chloroflexota bacterium]
MAVEKTTYLDRITENPNVMVGKPVVRGTSIPVERVIAHLAHQPDLEDLFAAYPELTLDDVKACLEYAHTAVTNQHAHRDGSRGYSGHVGGSSFIVVKPGTVRVVHRGK